MNLRAEAYHAIRRIVEFFQDQWFDRTRRVRTSGDVSLSQAGIAAGDSEWYVPARPGHIREALRAAPVCDARRYTYIDLGSGKGRSLFVAAELPFRDILGVELSERLHRRACGNIGSFRRRPAVSGGAIRSLHTDAASFVFPPGPLAVYLFNPFGESTMRKVLGKLEHSLETDPRHVVVILLWPRAGELVARVPGMRMVSENKRRAIFEAYASASGRDKPDWEY